MSGGWVGNWREESLLGASALNPISPCISDVKVVSEWSARTPCFAILKVIPSYPLRRPVLSFPSGSIH